ncbi:MAG: hypothetical protein C5B59_21020 [Bacteroidetes bacterium]|nr:MAG: hypothetical protein C5B59_21020 [Bacteroidota bacterium]
MTGLAKGDTLAIMAGNYADGGNFSHLEGITIINHNGPVNFGNTVSISHLNNVTITGTGKEGLVYGFRFSRFKGDAFLVTNKCMGLRIGNCEYVDVNGNAINAGIFFTVYNGDSSTMALYKTSIYNQHLLRTGALFVGSWAPVSTFQNVVDSISFSNVRIDSTISDVNQVLACSIYRMVAHEWTILGGCPNGKHDAGIFQTTGNGTIYNIYRNGGWGYLWRIWNVGLNGRADSYCYNCIDLNTDTYGTIDTRIDAADTTTHSNIPFLRGSNMHIFNNTSGNKRDAINYVSVFVVAGTFFSQNGYKLEIRNNLSFNTKTDNANHLVKQNTIDPLSDTSNNLYVDDPVKSGVLLDMNDCYIAQGSPVIDRGVDIPMIKTDIAGISRPKGKSYDIGAREFPSDNVTTNSAIRGERKILTLLAASLLVIGTIIFLLFRSFAFSRKNKKVHS